MSYFFKFYSKLVATTFHAPPVNLEDNIDGLNGDYRLITGKYGKIVFPIIFKQTNGKKLTDILDTGYPALYLISYNLKILLENNQITGWKTYPIKLYDKKMNEIFGYYGFSVTGVSGPISHENSEIMYKKYVSEKPLYKFYKGESFDLNNWDFNDFFIPEGTISLIITSPVKNVLVKNKISNFELIRLDEIEINSAFLKYK